jgi:large subunit ribosomal protein L20
MPRVKRGMMHSKRRKNVLSRTKGFMWGRKSKISLARTATMKAGQHAYNSRKTKKRDIRGLWQVNINAAVRQFGFSYSRFMDALKKKGILLNRKMLAEIAKTQPEVFAKITEFVK